MAKAQAEDGFLTENGTVYLAPLDKIADTIIELVVSPK